MINYGDGQNFEGFHRAVRVLQGCTERVHHITYCCAGIGAFRAARLFVGDGVPGGGNDRERGSLRNAEYILAFALALRPPEVLEGAPVSTDNCLPSGKSFDCAPGAAGAAAVALRNFFDANDFLTAALAVKSKPFSALKELWRSRKVCDTANFGTLGFNGGTAPSLSACFPNLTLLRSSSRETEV